MNVPRKHHYVPNFYLKGFTKEASEDGRLWVTDTKLKNQWPSSPKNSASEKDFYRAQLVQHPDPMWFEKLMANQVEPQLASILQRVLTTKEVPESQPDRDIFLNLVASNYVRGPMMRRLNVESFDRGLRDFIRERLSTEESRQSFLGGTPNLTAEKALELIDDKGTKFDLDPVTHIKAITTQAGLVLSDFVKRKWCVRSVADGVPDLICSDCPVAPLRPVDRRFESTPIWFNPTILFVMPLNRRTATFGSYQDIRLPDALDARQVTRINDGVMEFATQFYSTDQTFASSHSEWGKPSKKAGSS